MVVAALVIGVISVGLSLIGLELGARIGARTGRPGRGGRLGRADGRGRRHRRRTDLTRHPAHPAVGPSAAGQPPMAPPWVPTTVAVAGNGPSSSRSAEAGLERGERRRRLERVGVALDHGHVDEAHPVVESQRGVADARSVPRAASSSKTAAISRAFSSAHSGLVR